MTPEERSEAEAYSKLITDIQKAMNTNEEPIEEDSSTLNDRWKDMQKEDSNDVGFAHSRPHTKEEPIPEDYYYNYPRETNEVPKEETKVQWLEDAFVKNGDLIKRQYDELQSLRDQLAALEMADNIMLKDLRDQLAAKEKALLSKMELTRQQAQRIKELEEALSKLCKWMEPRFLFPKEYKKAKALLETKPVN